MEYRPEHRRGGQLVQDETGKVFVQWNVIKADDDDGYVAFAKDGPKEEDDRKRLGSALEDAKRKAAIKARNRKLAEQAAKQRQDKMRSVSKQELLKEIAMKPDSILIIAKAMIEDNHKPTVLKKSEFYFKMCELAELQRQDGETKEQAFAKYITKNEDGKLLFKASKLAPDDEEEKEEDEEEDNENESDAYKKLMAVAKIESGKSGKSVAQCFAKLYTDPANRALVRADKAEHVRKIHKAMTA